MRSDENDAKKLIRNTNYSHSFLAAVAGSQVIAVLKMLESQLLGWRVFDCTPQWNGPAGNYSVSGWMFRTR
ncbi:hypothetical protein MCEMSE15_01025 [Fimbriimonadaceae bacterium]